jgi:hypothetical protein
MVVLGTVVLFAGCCVMIGTRPSPPPCPSAPPPPAAFRAMEAQMQKEMNQGTLELSVNVPVADIFMDSVLIGQTAAAQETRRLRVTAGTHDLAVAKSGYETWKNRVAISSMAPNKFTIELEPRSQGAGQEE